ncbi:MAG TPA: zinc ribbon domain-containing protein [Chloroflexota bacterium]|nr:zinc ribbon domain-containing protein [Chloroflexota bacterium]
MKCKQCGNEVRANSRFCLNCGAAITPEAGATQSPPTAGTATGNDLWRRAVGGESGPAGTISTAVTGAPSSGTAVLTAPTPAAEGDGAPRRRARRDRPVTVPLSEFGKAPPPPPRMVITPRRLATTVGIVALVLTVFMVVFWQLSAASSSAWNQARCLDVRVNCAK